MENKVEGGVDDEARAVGPSKKLERHGVDGSDKQAGRAGGGGNSRSLVLAMLYFRQQWTFQASTSSKQLEMRDCVVGKSCKVERKKWM